MMLLKKYGLKFHEGNAHIWCMAHVVNLIVQALLTALGEAINSDTRDYYISDKHLPFHYDPKEDEEVAKMEKEAKEEIAEYLKDSDDELEDFIELLNPDVEAGDLEEELVEDISEVKKVHSVPIQI